MTRRPFDTLPPAQQAGILGNTPDFQRFAAIRTGLPGETATPTAAGEFIRQWCRVASRADITPASAAAQRLATLRTEYDAWRGRIASPIERTRP